MQNHESNDEILETTLKVRKDQKLILILPETIDSLRRHIWKTIFKFKGKLLYSDICMALGLVQQELIEHGMKQD